ncbi:glycosyltransferase [Halobacillus naozhouensis]|uniref:Glycosyltransferase n=1 Tax=Halobacillus naozhouensis TaxID=554880 RepID=A0ABY8IYV9_9BACI|nr:glycosyltransferase [Halobacillus naozhouensis]WFT73916.1 glycosyltransferase [Halobacillus naozhouensis]
MNKKVCFLVTEHPFLDARIYKKEARSLVKQGYEVTMIVPRKNGYLFDIDGRSFRDKFQSQSFNYDGIHIITYEQMHPEKNIKGLLYNLRSGGSKRFNDPLTQLGIAQQADIYHAHEFFSLYCGVGIRRALTAKGHRCKLIYDSHELEPDPLVAQPRNLLKSKQQMLELMLKDVDFVVTVSESIKSWYLDINPRLPVEVIYNSPPLAPSFESNKETRSHLIIAYEGVISKQRGSFNKFLDIIELCNQKFDLRAKIIGGWKDCSQEFSLPQSLKDKVEFTGWINYDSIPSLMRGVDVGWVDLDTEHSLNNRFAMPNKFFSYLNNGVPVLTNQCKDMESFIQTYQCGYNVKKRQATAEDYVQALLFLYSNREKLLQMSRQARAIMESQFSWEHMENRLFTVYDHLSQDL